MGHGEGGLLTDIPAYGWLALTILGPIRIAVVQS